jgi:hypothetical protein
MEQRPSASSPRWHVLRWLTQAAHHQSEEIRTLLSATFLQRTAAVVFASINVMVLAAITGFRTGAIWPLVWLVTDILLLIARLLSSEPARRAARSGRRVRWTR